MSNETLRHRLRKLLLIVIVSLLFVSTGYFANTLTDSYRTWAIINQELKRTEIGTLMFNPSPIEAYLDHTAYILFIETPFADERSGTGVQKCVFATIFYPSMRGIVEYKYVLLHDEQSNRTRLSLLERGTFDTPLPRSRCVHPAVTE